MKDKILIAGISGASLGTEVSKCLKLEGSYEIYGCDISSFAYGHYSDVFKETFVIDLNNYIESIVGICLRKEIKYIIPGAEGSNFLLSKEKDKFKQYDINIVSNNPRVVSLCSSKKDLFDFLDKKSVLIPKVFDIVDGIKEVSFPCIIKPSEQSGGSNFVYIAKNEKELEIYLALLISNNLVPVVQEYIDHSEGEFTVVVLS